MVHFISLPMHSKIKQIKANPVVAIAGEWFTAHGRGVSLGYFGKKENCVMAEKLKKVFAQWIDNGHTNFSDENTIILCVQLTSSCSMIFLYKKTPEQQ